MTVKCAWAAVSSCGCIEHWSARKVAELNSWLETLVDIALSPAFLLGLAIAVTCALVFAVIFGGERRPAQPHTSARAVVGGGLLASLIGFAVGQLAASALGSTLLQVGQLQVLWGTAGSIAALLLLRLLWPPEPAL
jgi:hypothetical protein